MESSAKMTCVLKVNFQCDGCKRKVMEVLQNLQGIYSVVIEAEEGTVRISGKVDPTLILSILDRYKKHGEISSLRFDGEVREERCYYPYYGGNHYIPYEPYPQYPPLGGHEFQLHGRNQYPLFPPMSRPPLPRPPTYWPLPPPPPPPRAPQRHPPTLPSPLPSTCPTSSAAALAQLGPQSSSTTATTQPAPQSSSAPQARPASQSSTYPQCCTTM